MKIIGLTGSIGMGKSTTAAMFEAAGIPVNNADNVVHQLYSGVAVPMVEAAFPGTAKNGAIDRQELSRQLAAEPDKFKLLESIVHPLVRQKEIEFLETAKKQGADFVILDIPLLFETGDISRVDKIIVVTCPADIQKQRVLARPGMTEEKFKLILSRQVPDFEKRAKADYIIDTGNGLDSARLQVTDIIRTIRALPDSETKNARNHL